MSEISKQRLKTTIPLMIFAGFVFLLIAGSPIIFCVLVLVAILFLNCLYVKNKERLRRCKRRGIPMRSMAIDAIDDETLLFDAFLCCLTEVLLYGFVLVFLISFLGIIVSILNAIDKGFTLNLVFETVLLFLISYFFVCILMWCREDVKNPVRRYFYRILGECKLLGLKSDSSKKKKMISKSIKEVKNVARKIWEWT